MAMFKPVHPGRILKDDYLEELELTVTSAAISLGKTKQTLDAIINERAGISPEMSLRLAKALIQHQNYGLIYSATMTFGRSDRERIH